MIRIQTVFRRYEFFDGCVMSIVLWMHVRMLSNYVADRLCDRINVDDMIVEMWTFDDTASNCMAFHLQKIKKMQWRFLNMHKIGFKTEEAEEEKWKCCSKCVINVDWIWKHFYEPVCKRLCFFKKYLVVKHLLQISHLWTRSSVQAIISLLLLFPLDKCSVSLFSLPLLSSSLPLLMPKLVTSAKPKISP